MARGSLLSLLGLYNYDNTIFNNLVVPDEVDKEVLINNILLESAELEVLFTNPDALKFAIGEWSKRRLQAWTRISNVLYQEYDPFINIKRDEERTITQSRNLLNNLSSVVTDNGSSTGDTRSLTRVTGETETNNTINTTNVGTGSTNTTHNVNGWDDDSASGVQKDTTNTTNNQRDTIATTENGTSDNDSTTNTTVGTELSTSNESRRSDRESDTGTITTHEKYHVEGDSAITDAQDVLKKEVQARQDLNIYNFIIKEFIERFCLLVY